MDSQRFANATYTIERIAAGNALTITHPPFETSREDVEAVVNIARWAWYNHRDDPALRRLIETEVG